MTSKQIRQKYLDFFKSKAHRIIPSASLIPENDSTTLFVGSGMQPLVQYLLGEKHPNGARLANCQKCFRAEDIDEVGDNRHNTFFEMLGNWSLNDYFKKEQLNWIFEFLTQELKLDANRIYVTVFCGNKDIGIKKDEESVKIWKEIFQEAGMQELSSCKLAGAQLLQNKRIFYYDETKNWWSRSGIPAKMPNNEIGGPDSEIFYDLGVELKHHEHSKFKNKQCHVNCDCGRFIEIGNSVFIKYIKIERGFEKLKQKNVDFGGGLERITMIVQNKTNVFETDLFINIINKIEQLSGKKYEKNIKQFEVIADHIKAAVFIIGDDKGMTCSNTGQGYVVRRLIRRAIRYGRQLEIKQELWTEKIARVVIDDYKDVYQELQKNANFIIEELKKEEIKFAKTLEKGLEEFVKLENRKQIADSRKDKDTECPIGHSVSNQIDGKSAFNLYQTYGFPIEMIKELAEERGVSVDEKEFKQELKKHQELSKTASAGKFKGGLADVSEETTKLHTTAHLLLAALRKVLGNHVAQKGSNITAERLRFDFSHSEKLTDEQKLEVENLVNSAIQQNLTVVCEEMSVDHAKSQGATGVFDSKYGEKVKVYTISSCASSCAKASEDKNNFFSKEICGGPHVKNTGELGNFKIIKEQSSSLGVRRIKAVLEFI